MTEKIIQNNFSNPSEMIKLIIQTNMLQNSSDNLLVYILKLIVMNNIDIIFNYIREYSVFIKPIILPIIDYFKKIFKINPKTTVSTVIKRSNRLFSKLVDEYLYNENIDYSHKLEYRYNYETNKYVPHIDNGKYFKNFDNFYLEFDINNIELLLTANSTNMSRLELEKKLNEIVEQNFNNIKRDKSTVILKFDLVKTDNLTSNVEIYNSANDFWLKTLNFYIWPKIHKQVNIANNLILTSGKSMCLNFYSHNNLIKDYYGLIELIDIKKIDSDEKFFVETIQNIDIYASFVASQDNLNIKSFNLTCIANTEFDYSKNNIEQIVFKHLNDFYSKYSSIIFIYQYNPNTDSFRSSGNSLKSGGNLFSSKKNKDILSQVFLKIENSNFFKKLGISNKCNLLLYGPPGTGKTSTIKYIANKLNKSIYMVNLLDIVDNTKMNQIYEKINDKNGIFVIEDIDRHLKEAFEKKVLTTTSEYVLVKKQESSSGLEKSSSSSSSNQENDSKNNKKKNKHDNDSDSDDDKDKNITKTVQTKQLTFDSIMNILDGLNSMDDSIMIMTCNNIEIINIINKALIRPGRIDFALLIDYCDDDQLIEILHFFTNKTFEPLLGGENIYEKKYPTVTVVYALAYYFSKNPTNIQDFTIQQAYQIIQEYKNLFP